MSKVLVVPDSHLKIEVIENGLALAKKYRADTIILLGDYFDDWHAVPRQYHDMIDYLKILLRTNPNVIPLLGNHELSYMSEFRASGFNKHVAKELEAMLNNDMRFLYAVAIDGVLYTHAGVCMQWLRNNKIITQNDLRLKLPTKSGADLLEDKINNASVLAFSMVGPARGGYNYPSPLWADLTELIADPAPVKQVVGHTPIKQIENIGRVWFTDVFSNGNDDNEYLLVVDGEPQIVYDGE